MAYVYRHIRHDKNQPFYIGIGTTDDNYFRAYQKSKSKRSVYWHNIAKNGYDVEILLDNLTKEEAFEKEIEFIKLYGRIDNNTGILCNHTDGGEFPAIKYGDENPAKRKDVREKLSKQRLGVNLSQSHINSLKLASKRINRIPPSRKGCKLSKETIDKIIKTRAKNGVNRKKIYQYDKENNLIKIWVYSKDIKIENPKYSIGNIHSVCRGERKYAYDCIWTFKPIL